MNKPYTRYRDLRPKCLNSFGADEVAQLIGQAMAECDDVTILRLTVSTFKGELQVTIDTEYEDFVNRVRPNDLDIEVMVFGGNEHFTADYANYRLRSVRDGEKMTIKSGELMF